MNEDPSPGFGRRGSVRRALAIATAIAVVCLDVSACTRAVGSRTILWPNTKQYDAKVATLALSPQAVHALRVEKTRDRPDGFFDPSPLFIIGDEYFFTVPEKAETRLQGHYVDGTTGVIRYRTSTKTVRGRAREFPEDAYQSVTVVSSP